MVCHEILFHDWVINKESLILTKNVEIILDPLITPRWFYQTADVGHDDCLRPAPWCNQIVVNYTVLTLSLMSLAV